MRELLTARGAAMTVLAHSTITDLHKGQEVRSAPRCLRLLEALMHEPGRVFTRAELESAVWSDTQETSDTLRTTGIVMRANIVSVFIKLWRSEGCDLKSSVATEFGKGSSSRLIDLLRAVVA